MKKIFILLLNVLLWCTVPSLAATIIVNNSNDSGLESLRAAITAANLSPGVDDIVFTGATDGNPIVLSSGELIITESVRIIGNGAHLTQIDGSYGSRIFNVNAPGKEVDFFNLLIRRGVAISDGGGILSNGFVDLFGVTIEECSSAANGGGLALTNGDAFIVSSSFVNNTAAIMGGGIYIAGSTQANFSNAVFGNNNCSDVISGNGAGIAVDDSCDLLMINCTVADNYVSGNLANQAGGILFASGTFGMVNCLLANNVNAIGSSDFSGSLALTINENNLVEATNGPYSWFLTADPVITMQSSCNWVYTYLLDISSPAYEAGTTWNGNAPLDDICGMSRIGNPEIGASEVSDCAQDTVKPTAYCTNYWVSIDDNQSFGSITPANINAGSYDDCGVYPGLSNMYLDRTDFYCEDVGLQYVTLTVVDLNGNESSCVSEIQVVGPDVDAGPDLWIAPGGEVMIQSSYTGTVMSFQWYPSDGLNDDQHSNPIASPTVTTKYIVKGTTGNPDCILYDTMVVKVVEDTTISLDIIVYELVTPNNDGSNDYLMVSDPSKIVNMEFAVYDRWGEHIYSSYGYNNEWDGRSWDGTPLSDGVYFYEIFDPRINRSLKRGKLNILGGSK